MTLIIETGNTKPATYKSRCARCHRIINIGDMERTAQVHSVHGVLNYRFASVHVPDCRPRVLPAQTLPR